MKYVNSGVRKKDAEALVTGQPVYTDDLAPKDCLIVKILRSPAWQHALIEKLNRCSKKYLESFAFLPIKMYHRIVLQWQVRLIRNLVRMTV